MTPFGIALNKLHVCMLPDGQTKSEVLDCLIDAVVSSGVVASREDFRRAVYERESIMSTGISSGVAIPHVRSPQVSEPRLSIGISSEGIDFNSLDKKPVHVVVLFAMPVNQHTEYLSILAQVMLTLKAPGVLEALCVCRNSEEVLALLEEDQHPYQHVASR